MRRRPEIVTSRSHECFPRFRGHGFRGEVASIQEADHSLGNIAPERLGTRGRKNGSFLPHTAKSGGLCARKYS